MRHLFLVTSVALLALSSASVAQNNVQSFTPVTQEMLENPSADDWLMYSRTYDAQRFSPLDQITRQNVGQLREVFKKELGSGNRKVFRLSTGESCTWSRPARASSRSMRRPARRSGSTSGRRARAGRRRSPSTKTWCSTRRRTASSWRSTPAPAR